VNDVSSGHIASLSGIDNKSGIGRIDLVHVARRRGERTISWLLVPLGVFVRHIFT
jgi:hypothetical protein